MLTKITLENFKVFRYATEFPLAKINLLTGINGRGKSSLLQSLLLMRQSIEHNENTDKLILNGNCVHLGTWEDVKNKDEKEDKEISISFATAMNTDIPRNVLNNGLDISISYCFNKKMQINQLTLNIKEEFSLNIPFSKEILDYIQIVKDKETNDDLMYCYNKNVLLGQPYVIGSGFSYKFLFPDLGFIDKEQSSFNTKFFGIYFSKIHYIAADRIGAKGYYPKTLNLGNFVTIDKKGENTVDILLHYKEEQVHKNLYREKNEFNGLQNLGQDLETQVGEWIGWVLDADVKVIYREIGEFVNQLEFEINGKKFKPSNVGFGYSYILPIITAGLIANEGEILIVENPEAHLHPKAQSRLTEFLAKVAATGVQVFVESHSDHILNALRVCVKQEKIPANDVNVLFFSTDKITQEPKVSFPKIDADGRIDVWEDDFFDEIDKSLMNLL